MFGLLLLILVGGLAADALLETALTSGSDLRFLGSPIAELLPRAEPLVIAGLGALVGGIVVYALAWWHRRALLRRFAEERREHEDEFWAATERVRATKQELENEIAVRLAQVDRLRVTHESMRRESVRIADRAATLESSLARSRDLLKELDQALLGLRGLPETIEPPTEYDRTQGSVTELRPAKRP